ncbi:MAG TPA: fumarylacetoacetate hydrolase family protein [Burkholderiales bacterium]|nr:fumarylacetoacetate hydrolase family protein [Burkholderiales bacterium]
MHAPPRGTVYGTLLNYRGALAALGEAVHKPPYKAPPRAPVLYIKPANTWIGDGAPIPVPGDAEALQMGAALGVVIGRTACRVPVESALDYVLGYTVVNDVSVPHDSFYRPSIRLKCRDGFCPISATIADRLRVPNPDALAVRVFVDGALRQENTTAHLIRSMARLLADITEFMTLSAGDVLLTGVPENAPLARAGQRVAIEIEGVGRLENPLVAEGQAG